MIEFLLGFLISFPIFMYIWIRIYRRKRRCKMQYAKGEIKDGEIIVFNSKEFDQSQLTSDCWLVQFDGLVACNACELRETEDCGGGETLERMRREVR